MVLLELLTHRACYVQGGEVISYWAGRSVINSCAQLAYGDAQAVIDAAASSNYDTQGAHPEPEVLGGFTWEQVRTWRHILRPKEIESHVSSSVLHSSLPFFSRSLGFKPAPCNHLNTI